MQARSKVNEAKKKEVELLKNLISRYKTVGVLDLINLPSPQLQDARKKLDVDIRVTKKRLLKIALNDVDKGVEKLNESLDDVTPALILTNQTSFKLAKDLRHGRSFVAAKAGQIAPSDLVVKAGPTSLPPGPIIGELGSAGVKASVEQGKVTVREDSVVVRAGNVISGKAADILAKLGIKPMELGLNLIATYENGQVFKKDVLDIDEKYYLNTLKLAVSEALNLSVNAGYVTEENIELFFRKAQLESLALEGIVKKGRDEMIKNLVQVEKEAEKLSEKTLEKSKVEPKKEGKSENSDGNSKGDS